MRSTSTMLLALVFLTLACALGACGGDGTPEPTGPMYLHIGPERWAELITSKDLSTKQLEMNRLGLGRTDAIPVLMALLDHENPDAVLAAFFSLEASLIGVERKKGDMTPWLPAIEKAVASTHPRVAELAPAMAEKYAGD